MNRVNDHNAEASLTLFAPAKVNLFLEVKARRSDGFHEIDTVMVAVDLFDQVDMVAADNLILTCSDPSLPTGKGNLVYQAAEALRTEANVSAGAKIHLTKKIPALAGLAGGSSDAAATLVGLNRIWQLSIEPKRLADIAASIGSDVAFFLEHHAARCTGRGEQVEPIVLRKPLHFVVVCPNEGLSTAAVYGHVGIPESPRSSEAMCDALLRGDVEAVGHELFNRLQEPAEELCPAVRELRSILARLRPVGVLMSGSGSSLFALCGDAAEAQDFARRLRAELSGDPAPRVFVVSTCVKQ